MITPPGSEGSLQLALMAVEFISTSVGGNTPLGAPSKVVPTTWLLFALPATVSKIT